MITEELGIISNIHVGIRDTNSCVCWFTVELLNGCALQVISLEVLKEIINKHQIYKLEDLNNKHCIVEITNGLVKFKGLK